VVALLSAHHGSRPGCNNAANTTDCIAATTPE
jgi:hypothetical protein